MEDQNQDSLFSQVAEGPLAHRMRPQSLGDVVGQRHFLNEKFARLLTGDTWTGLIFWGPPGTGKTTLATVIANLTQRPFRASSAVTAGVKDFRAILEASQKDVSSGKPAWILFIDEVHRLNKGQQDVLLPHLESGTIRFIGATTENPSFEINNAICSRCLIFHLEPLSQDDLVSLLKRADKNPPHVPLEVLEKIAASSVGDARRALTLLDHLKMTVGSKADVTLEDFDQLSHAQELYYDKKSEAHYDTISAFIKSVRGSDPDAALYYMARMIAGGEDPVFIARRLLILASEDIGNANPMGLVLATSALQAVHAIGMPEARIVLAQTATYLACSEKSNRAYEAIDAALAEVKTTGHLQIPMNLRNAPTKAMKEWGYGAGYQYAHKGENAWVKMTYLPDEIKDKRFYIPSNRGVEKRFQEFLGERGKPQQPKDLEEKPDA